jgi:isoleucyl-tRNA synthetase
VFRPVRSTDLDFVSMEQDVLVKWDEHTVFERSVRQRAGAPPWIFYEGPPTANNKPGVHHVWARVYKDLFCRYQTMRGRFVERKAGWDTHGLSVEVEVEKRLGISGKRAIEEKIGIARFTELCRESVHTYVDEFAKLTKRIGYWVDLDNPYWTLDPEYVDSVWWHLKTIYDKGLLYEDLKVLPYCPRCETPLSSHELGQPDVYTDEADLTAYVRLALDDNADAPDGVASLMVWTTTPWTLPSNVGAAVNPELTYAAVDGTVVAEALVESVFGEGAEVTGTFPGTRLVGLRYARPFTDLEIPEGTDAGVVVAADFVTLDEGTGIVHLAPAFGEVDRIVGRQFGLATLNPVGPDGRFTSALKRFEAQGVRDTNEQIVDELDKRGLLERSEWRDHSVPHCWRCNAVLIYWGKPSWYVATTQHKDDLLRENSAIDWHPEHIRDGRFGEWLSNNVDWALSRDRYWGTPLPIWRCPDGHVTVIGSRAELAELAGPGVEHVDPHRPTIDEVTFECPVCRATATRVAPVIDAWFDSGAMPAAQWGYPHAEGSVDKFVFPAEFIAEAIDQTRGWFYSLLAVNTLVFSETPYRHVLCLGHLVDSEGRKMSKSLGNVMDPWEVLNGRGADPLRWWMFSQGSPWTPTRASLAAIDATTRDMLLTLWNTYAFFMTFASLNEFDPANPDVPEPDARPELDRWALSRAARTSEEVTEALDAYEPLVAATAISALVDDLSNWYVRRSRRRFWRTDPTSAPTDALAAHATLHEVLVQVALLLAPMCPFLAEHLYEGLCDGRPEDSVHLCDWPSPDLDAVDEELEAKMASAREIVSLGRSARAEAGVKVRQPLRRALVFLPQGAVAPPASVVEDELNVDHVEYIAELSDVLTYELRPNFRSVGPKFGEKVRALSAALDVLDPVEAARRLEEGGTVVISLDGDAVELTSEDVELRVRAEPGFAVSRRGAIVVALDVELDDELRRRGVVRDLVRVVQELRKERGFDVADHLELWVTGIELSDAERDLVAREVLADVVHATPGPGVAATVELGVGVPVTVWLVAVA